MLSYRVAGLVGMVSVLLLSSVAHAQCTKDTDCKGDRVCSAGVCSAAPAGAAAPAAPAAAAAQPAPVAAAPVAAQPVPPVEGAAPVKGERHSTGMMAGGIVMVSMAPIALLVAAAANAQQYTCELNQDFGTGNAGFGDDCSAYDATIYGSLIAAVALVGIGVPLIVIGSKREAPRTATVLPWATAHAGGLGFRLDL